MVADQGLARAQLFMGLMYANGEGVVQDRKEAVRWYKLSADQGDAKSQFKLGVIYYNGQDVVQDYKEAAKWYRQG